MSVQVAWGKRLCEAIYVTVRGRILVYNQDLRQNLGQVPQMKTKARAIPREPKKTLTMSKTESNMALAVKGVVANPAAAL